ncbi:LGFP repeat-containing protein [Deinococcus aquaticus]|uniref:Uncharacterized protein n=1 Tax=Deinococcus aquaticus TaxID=328692 RepID=A0ABY7V028_9DEIO|nr:hypothetical protein [Deinococcus aquaticus]WDA58191.1 hypothetical protein M8445_12670 [Deinococcus aquaticus]
MHRDRQRRRPAAAHGTPGRDGGDRHDTTQHGATQNKVTHTTRLTVTDDETFGPHGPARVTRSGSLILDAAHPTHTDLTTGKCGGDAHLQLRVTYARTPGGTVTVHADARLFEGDPAHGPTAHDPAAHDRVPAGQVRFHGRVPSGQTRTLAARIRAADAKGQSGIGQLGISQLGIGDARVRVTVSNLRLDDTDPHGTLEAKARSLGAALTGPPTGPCEAVRGGHRRRYERCDLYFSPATGAHAVHGEIRRKYDARGGPDSDLALPVTDETTSPDGQGRFTHFQGNASVYWHPHTGPMIICGDLRAHWAASGWELGAYGYPTSDPLTSGPGECFSDLQGGVLYVADHAPREPATAHLSARDLLNAFSRALHRHVGGDPRLSVAAVTCAGVSGTAPDFTRSGNRTLTFRVTGRPDSGHWFIPEPAFELTIPVQVAATPPPDSRRAVTLIARQAGLIGIHAAPGQDAGATAHALLGHLTALFRAPIRLGVIPGHAGLLSVKVTAGGGLTLFFRPDERGWAAAALAQHTLDHLDF